MAQNNTIHNILEVVVGTADIRSSKQVKSGNLRKIATRINTSNMDDGVPAELKIAGRRVKQR